MIGIVVIAGSAGGLRPLQRIVAALPLPCTAAVFVVMHIGPHSSFLSHLLSYSGQLAASFAEVTPIEVGHIYVAPPDRHMHLAASRIRLSQGPKIHHARPAADPLFVSAAEAYGKQVLGIVLSGGDGDGAAYHGWVITPTARGCHVLNEETQQGSFFLDMVGRKNPGLLHRYHQDWVETLARAAEEDHHVGGIIIPAPPPVGLDTE
jgi:hypothetical protein